MLTDGFVGSRRLHSDICEFSRLSWLQQKLVQLGSRDALGVASGKLLLHVKDNFTLRCSERLRSADADGHCLVALEHFGEQGVNKCLLVVYQLRNWFVDDQTNLTVLVFPKTHSHQILYIRLREQEIDKGAFVNLPRR